MQNLPRGGFGWWKSECVLRQMPRGFPAYGTVQKENAWGSLFRQSKIMYDLSWFGLSGGESQDSLYGVSQLSAHAEMGYASPSWQGLRGNAESERRGKRLFKMPWRIFGI